MEVVNFLRDYWQFISTGLVVVIFIISIFVKKKPISEIVDNSATRNLIAYVREAEKMYGNGHGAEKLSYVITNYRKTLVDEHLFGSELDEAIGSIVEYILSTPQKKELAYEKVK